MSSSEGLIPTSSAQSTHPELVTYRTGPAVSTQSVANSVQTVPTSSAGMTPLTLEPSASVPMPNKIPSSFFEAASEFSTFEEGMRDIIRKAVDDIIRLHESRVEPPVMFDQLDLTMLTDEEALPKSSVPDPTDGDSATKAFVETYPALPDLPSSLEPHNLAKIASSSPGSSFADEAYRATGDLVFKLKLHLEKELISRRSTDGRELAHQLALIQGKNLELKQQVDSLTKAHSQDLDHVFKEATQLSDRVEILQSALQDSESELSRRRLTEEDSENIYSTLLHEQRDLTTRKDQALKAAIEPVTCSFCQELMRKPTTLSCGHSGCRECFRRWFEGNLSKEGRRCPICRDPVTFAEATNLRLNIAMDQIIVELKKAQAHRQ